MTYYDVDWSPRFDFGGPRSTSGLKGVCVHTSEGNPSITAENLANYQLTSQTGSYHVIVDLTGKRLRENTDDWITWSSGNQGNNILLHICFTARADWTRQQWLDQHKMLYAGATVVAHWCKTYGFPARKVDTRSLPGILGHDDTRAWGGTDHTDPGKNFPYDVFAQMVNDALNRPRTLEDLWPPTSSPTCTRRSWAATSPASPAAPTKTTCSATSTRSTRPSTSRPSS
ncbi:N-acetylmuramoyl-L-alanine amidase [Rhodococcus hoagii]|nr:N-acetylmuramoyl-L-alanine amidase [Prescottella equi]